MSLDYFVSITEDAQANGVAGIILVHERIIKEFGEPILNKVLLSVIKSVLDIEKPRKATDHSQRVFDVPIYLNDQRRRIAGIRLTLTERRIGQAPGARVVTVDWDGRVIEYVDPNDWNAIWGGDVA